MPDYRYMARFNTRVRDSEHGAYYTSVSRESGNLGLCKDENHAIHKFMNLVKTDPDKRPVALCIIDKAVPMKPQTWHIVDKQGKVHHPAASIPPTADPISTKYPEKKEKKKAVSKTPDYFIPVNINISRGDRK